MSHGVSPSERFGAIEPVLRTRASSERSPISPSTRISARSRCAAAFDVRPGGPWCSRARAASLTRLQVTASSASRRRGCTPPLEPSIIRISVASIAPSVQVPGEPVERRTLLLHGRGRFQRFELCDVGGDHVGGQRRGRRVRMPGPLRQPAGEPPIGRHVRRLRLRGLAQSQPRVTLGGRPEPGLGDRRLGVRGSRQRAHARS
jgi:hypothetical protein